MVYRQDLSTQKMVVQFSEFEETWEGHAWKTVGNPVFFLGKGIDVKFSVELKHIKFKTCWEWNFVLKE